MPSLSIFSAINSMPNRVNSGQVGGMNIGGAGAVTIEQKGGRHLDEAEAAIGEVARLDLEIAHMVHGEAETPGHQGGEAFALERAKRR